MPLAIDTTPLHRAQEGATSRLPAVSQSTRDRVKEKSPHGDRCIVENVPFHRAVDLCHVIPRRTTMNDMAMMCIEWHTGMEMYTFNVDTSLNLFYAGSSIHRMYDNGYFAFFPTHPKIVEAFFSIRYEGEREGWPALESLLDSLMGQDKAFDYTLVPLKTQTMQDIAFMHASPQPDGSTIYTIHEYPYLNLPPIRSHMRPQFVIWSLGLHLEKMAVEDVDKLDEVQLNPAITIPFTRALQLYRLWAAMPEGWERDESFSNCGQPLKRPEPENIECPSPEVVPTAREDPPYPGRRPNQEDLATDRTLRKRVAPEVPRSPLLEGALGEEESPTRAGTKSGRASTSGGSGRKILPLPARPPSVLSRAASKASSRQSKGKGSQAGK